MATSKEYKEFVLEQLDLLNNIEDKPMMGEFLLYYNNLLFGGIYDNRLLVKIVDTNKKYNMQEQLPYETGKLMYLVDDIDNKELMSFVNLNDLNYGNIVSSCDLVDCIEMTDEFIDEIKNNNKTEYIVGEYSKGRYAWILENIEILEKPIKAKGHLGVWNLELNHK